MIGRRLVGFIISRIIAGEAEILSVAVASARRGKGLARQMLNLHLRRLAGLGTHTVFLEVGEGNVPANRLYQRAGFRAVGRREGCTIRTGPTRTAKAIFPARPARARPRWCCAASCPDYGRAACGAMRPFLSDERG